MDKLRSAGGETGDHAGATPLYHILTGEKSVRAITLVRIVPFRWLYVGFTVLSRAYCAYIFSIMGGVFSVRVVYRTVQRLSVLFCILDATFL